MVGWKAKKLLKISLKKLLMFIYIHFVDVLSMSLMNVMKNNIVWKGRGMAGRNQEFI